MTTPHPLRTRVSWQCLLWPVLCEYSFALKDNDPKRAATVRRCLRPMLSSYNSTKAQRRAIATAMRGQWRKIHLGIWT